MYSLVKTLSCATVLLALLVSGPTAAQLPAAPLDSRGIPTLAPTLESVTPAVVNISVTAEEGAGESQPFVQQQPRSAAGSGVIVDAERGYVLTNHHVVADSRQTLVTLKDGRRFDAKLIGSDPDTDIALLQIDPAQLTELPLGDSDQLKVGDFVVAIGNPFGLGQTVTSGIVSAVGRSGLNIEGYEDFIQTDASINPGNSGGALVTLDGKLVGINTAILAPAGGNVGIGFAVPINMARTVMDQLIEFGEVKRGRLGVMIQDLTPELAEALNVETPSGAVITSVEKGGPGERAGIRAGDIVTEVNGKLVRGSADFRTRIGLQRAGNAVELTVLREGQRLNLRATVEKAGSQSQDPQGVLAKLAGADIRDILPGMPIYGQIKGVIVVDVAAGSPAAASGLRPGDVITAVNMSPVASLDEFAAALHSTSAAVALTVTRGDAQLFLVIQ